MSRTNDPREIPDVILRRLLRAGSSPPLRIGKAIGHGVDVVRRELEALRVGGFVRLSQAGFWALTLSGVARAQRSVEGLREKAYRRARATRRGEAWQGLPPVIMTSAEITRRRRAARWMEKRLRDLEGS